MDFGRLANCVRPILDSIFNGTDCGNQYVVNGRKSERDFEGADGARQRKNLVEKDIKSL